MTSDLVAMVISAAGLAIGSCHLLYKYYRRKKAMHEMVQHFIQDCFLIEQDYMEAFQAMIRKACLENAKENFRHKS